MIEDVRQDAARRHEVSLHRRVDAHNHTGDLCWWNGRIYSSVADRKERAGKGRLQVFDEDLNLLHDVETEKTMDASKCIFRWL